MTNGGSRGISRREMLEAGAALALVAGLPAAPALAQTRRWTRYNVADPAGIEMLKSYSVAVGAMLRLPPEHPHNWYRIAFIHFLDCPHGNWWFFPWHRGFTGYVEQIVRKYSGNPDFAFPYWDWTKSPEVPALMYNGALDPASPGFIHDPARFKSTYDNVLENSGYWIKNPKPGDDDPTTRFGQLLIRSVRFPDDAWFDIYKNPSMVAFFPNAMYPQGRERGILADSRGLDLPTRNAVSLPRLLDALSPRDFVTFGSYRTLSHSNVSGFGILEGQPHNKVHNNVGGIIYDEAKKDTTNFGGFMQNNLSPVDPLFFLHHANMDRLWDVWTRKQQAWNYPILPDGAPATPGGVPVPGSAYAQWAKEPFLFFVDADGKPTAKNRAGDFADIGAFDYRYQPGSGEEIVPRAGMMMAPRPRRAIQRIRSAAPTPSESGTSPALGVAVALPAGFLPARRGAAAPLLFAKVTVELPHDEPGTLFEIRVHAGNPATARVVDLVSLFGGHAATHGPVTFTLALSGVLAELDGVRADKPIYFQVVEVGAEHGSAGHGVAEVVSVTVEAH
jgi:tyrosinase